MGPSGQGYISDYYLNNNKKRVGPYNNEGGGPPEEESLSQTMNGADEGKVSNKKFFKSKIDFMAPVKSLRGPQNVDPTLSDDTNYYEQQ
jgi:hypothetical protein